MLLCVSVSAQFNRDPNTSNNRQGESMKTELYLLLTQGNKSSKQAKKGNEQIKHTNTRGAG